MSSPKNLYMRVAAIVVVASVILLAGLVMGGSLVKASSPSIEANKIHATGTISSVILAPPVANQTVGAYQIITDRVFSTYDGDIQGKTVQFRTRTINTNTKMYIGASDLSFNGTIAGKSGSFAATLTIIGDQSNPAHIVYNGTVTVVEGSGMGGLKGICGGGTFEGSRIGSTPYSTYDYNFRFGSACSSNP